MVLRYCGPDGTVAADHNPNGSTNSIAGITNEAGNVVGLMPHPERAAEQLIGMFLGLDLLRTQIGQKASGSASRKRRCREAVAVFLKGHGATS